MISDREIQVFQVDGAIHIIPWYKDDPYFTDEQEQALYEIAKAMLIMNRRKAAQKRARERQKAKKNETD